MIVLCCADIETFTRDLSYWRTGNADRLYGRMFSSTSSPLRWRFLNKGCKSRTWLGHLPLRRLPLSFCAGPPSGVQTSIQSLWVHWWGTGERTSGLYETAPAVTWFRMNGLVSAWRLWSQQLLMNSPASLTWRSGRTGRSLTPVTSSLAGEWCHLKFNEMSLRW